MPTSSKSGKQTIRPSFDDLATYDADKLEWPPSASVSRGIPPPALAGKNSSSKTKAKSVTIAEPSEDDVRYYEPAPKERPSATFASSSASSAGPSRFKAGRVAQAAEDEAGPSSSSVGRFVLPLDGEGETQEQQPISSEEIPRSSLPVIGGVQERSAPRKPTAATTTAPASSLPSGTSRFRAMRDADRKSGSQTVPTGLNSRARAPPNLKPPAPSPRAISSLRTPELEEIPKATRDEGVIAYDSDEEWLDEDGKVMSAFRKARLQKRGQEPPGGIVRRPSSKRAKQSTQDEDEDDGDPLGRHTPADSSETGEGDFSTLLSSISKENDDKLKSMKPADIEQDLKDLESMFGKDMLEGLRNRKAGGAKNGATSQSAATTSSSSITPAVTPSTAALASATTKPASPSDRLIFDSTGKLLPISDHTDHHAAHDQEHGHAHPRYGLDPADASNEGFSLASLFLLARSTVAGQRIVALNILSRIAVLYPSTLAFTHAPESRLVLEAGQLPGTAVAASLLDRDDYHIEAAVTATMLLLDRQRSVRGAALSCMRVALLFAPLSVNQAGKKSSKGRKNALPAPQRLLQAGLLSGFWNIVRGGGEEQASSRELITVTLLQLVTVDRVFATALLKTDKGRLLTALVNLTLKVDWPSKAGPDGSSSPLPVPASAQLLLEIARSSRSNAQALIASGHLDVLLRFVALLPWELETLRQQEVGYEIATVSLNIFISLARYGFYASLVSRAWDLFDAFNRRALSELKESSSDLSTAEAELLATFYRLLAIWTVCASDPHQTTPEHEVTWSQAEGWIDSSLDVLKLCLSSQDRTAIHIAAGVTEHILAWLEAAEKNGPVKRQEVLDVLKELFSTSVLSSPVLSSLSSLLETPAAETDEDEDEEAEESLATLVFGCDTATNLLSLARAAAMLYESATKDLLEFVLKFVSDSKVIEQIDSACVQHRFYILALVTLALELSPATSHNLLLRYLASLRPGEEIFAVALIELLLKRSAAGDENNERLLSSLKPFYLECLGIRPNSELESKRLLHVAPVKSSSSDLKRTLSLRTDREHVTQQSVSSESDETVEEGVELDPITSSPLWTSPSSGLPLRPDWQLCPLDDLLHSATCAVFNRADNLPKDWDPNEREVVQATLAFTNWCLEGFSSTEEVSEVTERLVPSSNHLYFAAQKIFMLESGIQGDLRKSSGAVTGKDLFRDPTIRPHLSRTFALANEASKNEDSETITLVEELAPLHLGSETSYYSFYTDLVGLYDSISFGDELFALSLLPPTAAGQPTDYRRLLWNDYAHCLPGIKVALEQAPGGWRRYVSDPTSEDAASDQRRDEKEADEEQVMLQAYLFALSGQGGEASPLTLEEQPLLYRIAIHQVALYLWSSDGDDKATQRKIALRRSLFGQAPSSMTTLRDHLLRYDLSRGQVPDSLPLLKDGSQELEKRNTLMTSKS